MSPQNRAAEHRNGFDQQALGVIGGGATFRGLGQPPACSTLPVRLRGEPLQPAECAQVAAVVRRQQSDHTLLFCMQIVEPCTIIARMLGDVAEQRPFGKSLLQAV
jgi:hypothetical protein